jgi:ABC-type glutathione transport system ATPase component
LIEADNCIAEKSENKKDKAAIDIETGTKKTTAQSTKNKTYINSTRVDGVQVDAVNLSYSIVVKKKRTVLLRNINFHVQAGDMCAVIGPSGAGKSFLFFIL